MISYKQLSLAQIFSDCSEKFENDKYQFLSLLENNIDLDEFVSISFRNHYHASTGRPRKFPLTAMLWALLLQRIFSIPTDALLIIFLQYSKESFYNKDFLKEHHIVIEKKSDFPDEDKSLADSKALIPVLKDFFAMHPLINPKTFLGDSAFDTIPIYQSLFHELGFEKAYIPLNNRSKLTSGEDYIINDDGIPCCPHDTSLPMKPEGNTSHLRCGIKTFKFVCPKMSWDKCDDRKFRRISHCDNPCTHYLIS